MIGRGQRHPNATKPTAGGERGQALVLIVLLVSGLVAFAALAIDGGNYYSHRRIAQNASDAGSLRGAFVMATSETGDLPTEEELLAAINTVIEGNAIPDSNGIPGDEINTNVSAYFTDKDGVVIHAIDPDDELAVPTSVLGGIRVEVGYPIGTYLAGLLGWRTLPVEASAVAAYDRGEPKNPLAAQGAVIALSLHDCKSLEGKGTSTLLSVGGGIFVNSDAISGSCPAAWATGGGVINGGEDGIYVVGTTSGSGTFSEPLVKYPTPVVQTDDFLAYLRPPEEACQGPALKRTGGGNVTISPGHYSEIKRTGGVLTMTTGIYCIDSSSPNTGFVITGGASVKTVEPTAANDWVGGVLIYLKRGSFSTSGGGVIELYAMQKGEYDGLLIFSDPTNDASNTSITVTGASGSTYKGTIYAPNNSCDVRGNGVNLGLYSRVMCDNVWVTGDGLITVYYNEEDNIQAYTPPIVSLYE